MAITTTAAPRRIDEMLTAARACLNRLTPREAHESARSGAVVVDIRPEPYRHMEGEIAGAIFIERNVLEWRLDPTSHSRLPIAHYDLPIIVVCNEGYASSLAAAAPSRNSASTAPPTSSAGSAPGAPLACRPSVPRRQPQPVGPLLNPPP